MRVGGLSRHRSKQAPGSLDPPSTIKLSSGITFRCSNSMQCVGPHRQDDAEASSSPPCCPSSFNNQTTAASLLAVYSMQYSGPIGKTIPMHLHHHHQLAARHRSPPSSSSCCTTSIVLVARLHDRKHRS
jgi:hypothetical protein